MKYFVKSNLSHLLFFFAFNHSYIFIYLFIVFLWYVNCLFGCSFSSSLFVIKTLTQVFFSFVSKKKRRRIFSPWDASIISIKLSFVGLFFRVYFCVFHFRFVFFYVTSKFTARKSTISPILNNPKGANKRNRNIYDKKKWLFFISLFPHSLILLIFVWISHQYVSIWCDTFVFPFSSLHIKLRKGNRWKKHTKVTSFMLRRNYIGDE